MTPERIYVGILQYAVLLFSLVFHEFGHAWTALRCGDPTAKHFGRVTLNPAAHADLIGTVFFPLLQIFSGVPLIGWAKPVPVNPGNLRHPRRDDMLVAAAGPGFNLILALVAALLWRLNGTLLAGFETGVFATLHGFLSQVLPLLLQINVLLALFNLIPMPPLDGSYILYHLLPRDLAVKYRAFGATWGFIVVLALVYTGVARSFISFGFALVSPIIRVIAGI
jgi:Zn-dependent protease